MQFLNNGKVSLSIDTNSDTNDFIVKLGDENIKLKNLKCKHVYRFFVSSLSKQPTAVQKWTETYKIPKEEWSDIFQLPYKICCETKLQTFQFKLINRIIACNYNLKLWNIVNSSDCNYCLEEDTMEHFFYSCLKIKLFW